MATKPILCDEQGLPETSRLLCMREVTAFLGVSDRSVRTFVTNRELPAIRLGRRVLFDPADVHRFIDARRSRSRT